MSVNISIVGSNGLAIGSIAYATNAVTATVKNDLRVAFGAGLLKQSNFGVTAENLQAGDYQYVVTAPVQGKQP